MKRLLSFLFLTGCVAIPKPPDVPLCIFDNYSKSSEGRDYAKAPAFHCTAANGSEFEIPWNSASAKNMVSTPHDDYVRLNSYYKKVFEIVEKELLKRSRGK